MLMVSDAERFWQADVVAAQSQFAWVRQDGTLDPQNGDMAGLKGKSVVVLFHGYDNEKEDVLQKYFKIQQMLQEHVQDHGRPFYDAVIGYRVPLCDDPWEFLQAESNAKSVASRVGKYLAALSMQAQSVDVIAHSLGNRVVLEALKTVSPLHDQAAIIHRLFSLAAAVDNESVERGEVFQSSDAHCKEVVVFYSKNDGVLQGAYPLVKWDRALGHTGAEHPYRLPKNVQQVDCSDIVSGHSGYFDAVPVFHFIRDKMTGKLPPASAARSLILGADGTIREAVPSLLERVEETFDRIVHGQK